MWLRVAVARLSPVTGGLPGLPEQRIHVAARNGHDAVVELLREERGFLAERKVVHLICFPC